MMVPNIGISFPIMDGYQSFQASLLDRMKCIGLAYSNYFLFDSEKYFNVELGYIWSLGLGCVHIYLVS